MILMRVCSKRDIAPPRRVDSSLIVATLPSPCHGSLVYANVSSRRIPIAQPLRSAINAYGRRWLRERDAFFPYAVQLRFRPSLK